MNDQMTLFTERRRGYAHLSECGRYRYLLYRMVENVPPARRQAVVFVLLNPSTADATRDDPTVRKLLGFARRWGKTDLFVVNLFGYRSPYPAALTEVDDPVGPDNNMWMQKCIADLGPTSPVICGWGRLTAGLVYQANMLLQGPYTAHFQALRVNKDGSPCHPLYLPYRLEPGPYPPEGANG